MIFPGSFLNYAQEIRVLILVEFARPGLKKGERAAGDKAGWTVESEATSGKIWSTPLARMERTGDRHFSLGSSPDKVGLDCWRCRGQTKWPRRTPEGLNWLPGLRRVLAKVVFMSSRY